MEIVWYALPNENDVYNVLYRTRALNPMTYDTGSHRHLVFIKKNCILLFPPCFE
jgi:hypothetical protein